MADPRRSLTEVSLRNYKSIASCDLQVGPLVILIGPNGAGKSNFLDALRLVSEALRRSLTDVIQERGGFREIRHRGVIVAGKVAIMLKLQLPAGTCTYGFQLDRRGAGYVVAKEVCLARTKGKAHGFGVKEGTVTDGPRPRPPADPTELYLSRVGGIKPFDKVFQHLSSMAFYSPNVDRIRDLQALDDGQRLKRDGSNLASVLKQLDASAPEWKAAVDEYLHAMAPQILGVKPRALGPKLTLQFLQSATRRDGSNRQRRFLAENMSDGALRGLGVLVALLQGPAGNGRTSLIGVEEPELALHTGAFGALTDVLLEASESTQTMVTTHSTDLLDSKDLPYQCIYPVELDGAASRIGVLDEACVEAIEGGDFTVGELLSMGQASPRFAAPQRRVLFPRRGTDG